MYDAYGESLFRNCVFDGNNAATGTALRAGAIVLLGGTLRAEHCTWTGNAPDRDGKALHCFRLPSSAQNMPSPAPIPSTVEILNSILWNGGSEIIDESGVASITIRYSIITGGWMGPGDHNLDAHPRFRDRLLGRRPPLAGSVSCD